MNLKDYSVEQLQEELQKREREFERPQVNPNLKDLPELKGLISTTESIINEIVDGSWHEDNDDAHYVYEEAFKALYGKDFFDWFNRNTY